MSQQVPPFTGMDAALAAQMIRNYAENHLAVINDSVSLAQLRRPLLDGSISPTDARCVWFSLSQLQSFINQIQGGCANNAFAPGQLGVRIYFAEYPSVADIQNAGAPIPGFNPHYAGMQTVIMVPTYHNDEPLMNDTEMPNNTEDDAIINAFHDQHHGAMHSVDFDPNCFDQGNAKTWDEIYSAPAAPETVTMLNHGGIIPPPFRVAVNNLFMDFTG